MDLLIASVDEEEYLPLDIAEKVDIITSNLPGILPLDISKPVDFRDGNADILSQDCTEKTNQPEFETLVQKEHCV